jgi:cell wall-associated NlpC family hydrolase
MRKIDAAIAAEAGAWIGTPFVWGQSVKGQGCDCKGLIAGVLRELGRPEADSVYGLMADYRADRPVPAATLLEGFERLFERADKLAPGHILLLNFGGRPGHMAIIVAEGRAVNSAVGSVVKERPFEVLFHKTPLHSIWRVPTRPKCR